jgi:hypothetical protein
MSEKKSEDPYLAPGKLMFFTWVNNMIVKKQAKFNEDNKSIIDLSNFAASWFCIGREEEGKIPFIGIQENMTPWFFEISWKRANISKKYKKLYLSCSENSETPDLTISIPIREARIKLIHDELDKDEEKFLDFRMTRIDNDGNVEISKKSYKTVYLTDGDDEDKLYAKPVFDNKKDLEIDENVLRKTFDDKIKAFDDGFILAKGMKNKDI